ncbi:MAG: Na+:solute symporter [Verrucomicrobiota bacterium JB024]|nr:Na+:solute symporter [Verrucomicrobiota bacterium JB024]
MFVAGRQSPWWISGLSAYMTMFSAGTFVVWGGIAYEFGLVAVSISMGYAVSAFIVGFFLAGRWRALGVSTAGEYIRLRFGNKPFMFYTWFKVIFSFTTGLALYGLARVICPLIQLPAHWFIVDPDTVQAGAEVGQLSVFWACGILGFIVVAYTMVGGLWAVLLTDTLQFFVLTVSVLLAVILGLNHIGGLGQFLTQTPEGFLNFTAGDFTLIFLFGWMLVNAFQLGAEWQFLQRYFCVSKPEDARKALYLFGILYLILPLFFMAPAMFYRVITDNADPEEAYILMCREVLPPGMIGMMVAALFSATASMVSSVLNVYASVLTDDVYKGTLRPNASERETVHAGRIITIMIGAYMVAGSILIPSLTTMRDWIIIFTSLIAPALLLPTIWGLYSRKITQSAVWWCVIANVAASLLVRFGFRAGGWFGGIEFLAPAIHLNESNMRVSDIMVGIIAPVVVLIFMEFRAKKEAEGWRRLTEVATKNQREETPSVVDSHGPATVMVWCLGFLSAIMLIISIINPGERKVLISATILLLAITVLFIPLLKKTRRPLTSPGS